MRTRDRKESRRLVPAALKCSAAMTLAFSPIGAIAQDFDPRTPLESRARPEYSPTPITVGAFEVRPQIDASVEYVDNLFASEALDVDDVIVSIRPSVTVTDRRQDRELRLNLGTGYQKFLGGNSGDLFQILGRANARFGLGTATRPYAGATFRLNDAAQFDFGSGANVAQPLKTVSYGGNLGVQQDIGRVTLDGEGRYERFEYSGPIFFGAVAIDGNLRNYSLFQGRARVGYANRPDQRIYVEGRYGRFDFDNFAPIAVPGLPAFFTADRSGDNLTGVAGIQLQITDVLSFDGNLGYTRLEFDDPALSATSAFSAEANVFYAPTRLTRFQLQVTRSVDDTINPLFSSFLRTGFALVAEHELRRNLLIRGEARYVKFDTGDAGLVGDEYQLGGSMVYFLSPSVILRLRGEHFDRSGFAAGEQRRLLLSVGYRF